MEDDAAQNLSDAGALTPLCAAACCLSSCYTDWPECCGCRCKGVLCCLAGEEIFCKPACDFCGEVKQQLKKNPRTCCVITEGTCICINPDSCCNVNQQCFCVDCRLAFPPGTSDDLPCLITILFITCCYQYGCNCGVCAQVKDLKAKVADGGAPTEAIIDLTPRNNTKNLQATPAAQEMLER